MLPGALLAAWENCKQHKAPSVGDWASESRYTHSINMYQVHVMKSANICISMEPLKDVLKWQNYEEIN